MRVLPAKRMRSAVSRVASIALAGNGSLLRRSRHIFSEFLSERRSSNVSRRDDKPAIRA